MVGHRRKAVPEGTFKVWNGLGHAERANLHRLPFIPAVVRSRSGNMRRARSSSGNHVDIKWDFAEITDTAQTGDATIATAEKNSHEFDCLVDAVVKDIEEPENRMELYNTSHCATKS